MTLDTETRALATPEIVELVARPAAIVRVDATLAEFPGALGAAFRDTANAILQGGAVIAGHPFARYLSFRDRIVAEVGFPFAGSIRPEEPVQVLVMPGGRAVKTLHVGSYDTIGMTWERAQTWMREQGLEQAGPAWECYLNGPDEPEPTMTEVFWPIG
jgi:effector-binding domain-containing protein